MAETQTKPTALERTKELTDRLEAGIQDLLQSDKYMEYLKSMSQFHRYSTRNTLLIHVQNPNATRVASFKLWDEQFNRHVKKGEKSIRIFAPISPPPEKKLMEKLNPDTGTPLLDESGKPVMEEMTAYSRPRFKLVPVFDVSQTYGDPLPELVENLTGNVEQYEAFLDTLRDVSPLPMEFEPLPENNDGYCRYGEKIGIREGMSEVQTVSAVVHEITHARLHDKENMVEMPENAEGKSKRMKEVEAESVSYVVCQHFGIETSPNSFGYLAEWGSDDMSEFKASLDTIRKESNALITAIDERFQAICKERGIDLSTKVQEQAEPEVPAVPGQTAEPSFTTETRTENIAGVNFTATDIIPEQQPKEIRPIGDTVLMPLVFNNDGNFERTSKRTKVKIEPPIGKYSVYSREINGLDDPYYYLLTDSGRLVSIYGAGNFGGQSPDTVTEQSIDAYFAAAKESFDKAVQDSEAWADFNHAAIANRLDEAEAHNQPVREAREVARTQAAQERQSQEEAESAAFEEQFNFSVDKIAQGLVNGDRVDIVRDRYVDKNPLFTLLDHHGVELPLATKGWVNRNLKAVQMLEDGACRMWLPKGIKPSHTFSHAMGELKERIAVNLSPEQTHTQSNTILHNTAAEPPKQEEPYEITYWLKGTGTLALHYFNEGSEHYGDYEELADIAPDRSVTFLKTDLPDEIKEKISAYALTADIPNMAADISANEAPAVQEPSNIMPDPSITAAERDSYGYTAEDMLPLRQDKSLALLDADHTIYMLYDDDTEVMVFDRDEIITFAEMNGGIFGIAKGEWETSEEYAELKAQDSEAARESNLIHGDANFFAIYQLKDGEELRYHRFASMNQLEADNLTVDRGNYNRVYAAPLLPTDTPEEIYRQFNHAHPHDFTGRSVSVSDIIVIQRDGELASHYVDNFGMTGLPTFLGNEKQAEVTAMPEQEQPMATPVVQTKLSEMLGLNLEDSKTPPDADLPINPTSVYRESIPYAREHDELDQYRADTKLNAECRDAIHTAINESRYDSNFYKMKDAAKQVLDTYGSERVELIMAKIVQGADWDGRYSRQNKEWAKGFEIPQSMKDIYSNTHPCLLDGFLEKVREKPSVLETLRANAEKSRGQSEPKQDNKKSKEMEM